MRKSFIKVMFFGALALSTATYVGCKDYDDDINSLQEQIDANKAGIAELKQKVDNGSFVKSVEAIAGGFKITFNDNKSYEVVNGKDGAAGANGSIVSINGDGMWCIDGKPTAYSAVVKDGVDGKSPFIKDGFWYFYQPTNAGAITEGELKGWVKGDATTGTADIYVVQEAGKPCYTLHAKDKETGEWLSTPLPNAMKISSMKAISVKDGAIEEAADVILYYGTVGKDITFGPKGEEVEYKKGQFLTSNSGTIQAIVNPVDVDLTSVSKYTINLTDSKGNSDFTVKSIAQNMSEEALKTRATGTANKGIFDLTVALKDDLSADKLTSATNRAYALTTQDAWGQEIISAYDVKIVANNAAQSLTNQTVTDPIAVNVAANLDELFNQYAIANAQNPLDVTVAHYYEPSTAYDLVTINGNTITSGKPYATPVVVNVHYLKVDGTKETRTLTINTFKNIVTTATVNDATWKVSTDGALSTTEAKNTTIKAYVGDDLNTYFTQYAGSVAGDKFKVTEADCKLTGANEAGEIEINEGQVVTHAAGNDIKTFAIVKDTKDGKYYITATADPEKVIATTYNFVLNMVNDGNSVAADGSNVVKNINWKITVVQDNTNLFDLSKYRKANYFIDNSAWAAGTTPTTATGEVSSYNLLSLYAAEITGLTTKVAFTEVIPNKGDGTPADAWIVSDDKVSPSTATDAEGGIYTARTFKVQYKPFNNNGWKYINDEFALTIGSLIYGKEGKLITFKPVVAGKWKSSLYPKESCELAIADFSFVDAYGAKYTFNGTTVGSDLPIASYEVVLKDQNAKDYLTLAQDGNGVAPYIFGSGFDKPIVVTVKADAKLEKDAECTLALKVTDAWGKETVVDIPFTAKKTTVSRSAK